MPRAFGRAWVPDGNKPLRHTCEAPGKTLDKWLKQYPSTVGNYGDLLLEQVGANDAALIEKFRPYFESAHVDARKNFHEEIDINLHLDAMATSLLFMPTKCQWLCAYQRSTAHVSPVGVHTNDTAGRPPASSAMPRNVLRSIPECAPPFGWLCHVPIKAR